MKNTRLFATAVVIASLTGCSGNSGGPSLGSIIGGREGQYVDAGLKAGSTLTLTEADEDEMGRAVAIAATNKWRLYDNPAVTKYVTLVGLTVTSASDKPDGNWIFGVLDTPDIGAYSGPNGYILVTRGAINAMQDEAELAAVLAHEISHVLDRDGMNAVKNAKLSEAGMQAASAADQRVAQFNQLSGQLVTKTLESGWNQSQETSADEKAVRLLQASGYDPTGLPRFLQRLQQAQRGRGSKVFATHPGTADRISRTTAQIGSAKAGATNRDRFARNTSQAKL
jgi:predicted Zn-dependent protease